MVVSIQNVSKSFSAGPVLKDISFQVNEGDKLAIIGNNGTGKSTLLKIVNDYGKFALHTLPSGVFYGHTTSIIGNGVALDVPKLFNEIKSITDKGVPTPKILVSDQPFA